MHNTTQHNTTTQSLYRVSVQSHCTQLLCGAPVQSPCTQYFTILHNTTILRMALPPCIPPPCCCCCVLCVVCVLLLMSCVCGVLLCVLLAVCCHSSVGCCCCCRCCLVPFPLCPTQTLPSFHIPRRARYDFRSAASAAGEGLRTHTDNPPELRELPG